MKIMILIVPLQLLMIHNLTNEIKLFPKIVVFTPIERYSEKKNFLYKISHSNRNKDSNGGTRFIKESSVCIDRLIKLKCFSQKQTKYLAVIAPSFVYTTLCFVFSHFVLFQQRGIFPFKNLKYFLIS